MPEKIWISDGGKVYWTQESVYSCDLESGIFVFAKDSLFCTQYTRSDLVSEVTAERGGLREALILFYELLSALHKDLINSGRRSPIPMKAVEAKYKKALEGREE